MIGKSETASAVQMMSGVVRKTLVVGDRMLLAQFSFEAGAVVPVHQHPHEQVGYVISGRQRLTVGDEVHFIEGGDSYFIPGGVPHATEAITDSVAVDTFCPPREDYIPADREGPGAGL
ncbi:MAG: cupin domain-containing protein [Bacillota bacterium]